MFFACCQRTNHEMGQVRDRVAAVVGLFISTQFDVVTSLLRVEHCSVSLCVFQSVKSFSSPLASFPCGLRDETAAKQSIICSHRANFSICRQQSRDELPRRRSRPHVAGRTSVRNAVAGQSSVSSSVFRRRQLAASTDTLIIDSLLRSGIRHAAAVHRIRHRASSCQPL